MDSTSHPLGDAHKVTAVTKAGRHFDPLPTAVTDQVIKTYDEFTAFTLSQEATAGFDPAHHHHAALSVAARVAYDLGHREARDEIRDTANGRVRDTFTAVFAQAGEPFTGDPGEVLHNIAEQAGQALRTARDAMHTGAQIELPAQIATLTALLAVVSAGRAGLGYTPTAIAEQIIAEMCAEDVTTAGGDEVRLHLLAGHGNLNGLNVPDRIAALIHAHEHDSMRPGGHPVSDLSWDEEDCRAVLDLVPADAGRDAVLSAFEQVLARYDEHAKVTARG